MQYFNTLDCKIVTFQSSLVYFYSKIQEIGKTLTMQEFKGIPKFTAALDHL
jgi:hypothetical protein